MQFVSFLARRVFGSQAANPGNRPAMMEALENRQLLSATVSTVNEPTSTGPVITLPAVQSIGVKIDAVADVSFTAVVGKVKGLSKSVLGNLKGLHATIAWNDYVGDTTTSQGVLSVNNGTLIVTGTRTYHYSGEHNITVTVSTVPPVAVSPATTIAPVVLATIHSTAEVSVKPIGVTFGVSAAGVSFTGVVGKVEGLDKSVLQNLAGQTVTIYWGDHSTPSAGTLSADTNGLVSVTGTHTYALDGQYNVTINIKTTPPTTSTVAPVVLAVIHSTADVAFVQPVGVTFHAEAGEPFAGVVGTVKGLDLVTLGDVAGLQAVITWGDGSAAGTGTLTVNNAGVLVVRGSHTYANAGKYAVTVVVETIPPVVDPPAIATAPLVVATINSYAAVAPNTEGGVHLDEIVSKKFTAILGTYYFQNTANYVQSATIDWGDGSTSKGTILSASATIPNWAVQGSHEYSKAGNHKVTITVTATPASTGGVADPIILVVATLNSTIDVLGKA